MCTATDQCAGAIRHHVMSTLAFGRVTAVVSNLKHCCGVESEQRFLVREDLLCIPLITLPAYSFVTTLATAQSLIRQQKQTTAITTGHLFCPLICHQLSQWLLCSLPWLHSAAQTCSCAQGQAGQEILQLALHAVQLALMQVSLYLALFKVKTQHGACADRSYPG